MEKENTTLSIDSEVKKQGKIVLEKKGWTMSFVLEQALRSLIKNHEKEVDTNGIFK